MQVTRAHEVHGVAVGVLAPGGSAFDETDGNDTDRQGAEDSEDYADASGGGWGSAGYALVFNLDNDALSGTIVLFEALGDFINERGALLFDRESAHGTGRETLIPGLDGSKPAYSYSMMTL